MNILGVYVGHDLGACLLRDGKIIAFIEEERLTRFRHGMPSELSHLGDKFNGRFGYVPWASINYCLEAGQISIDDLDLIVLPDKQMEWASLLPIRDKRKIWVIDTPVGGTHHYCHALSAFYGSSFESAAVLIVDGSGSTDVNGYEAESGYYFSGRGSHGKDIFKNRYVAEIGELRKGLGWSYEYVTTLLGFINKRLKYSSDAGKTMGLAAYGKPNLQLAADWFQLKKNEIKFDGFHRFLNQTGFRNLIDFSSSEKALIQNESNISQLASDFAFKIQSEIEQALLHLAEHLYKQTRSENLCFAGGVALNSVANGLIDLKGPFKNFFVHPACADTGQALGLALAGHLKLNAPSAIAPLSHAFGGKKYLDEDIQTLLERAKVTFKKLGGDDELARSAAQDLSESHVIGWFQGGSEFGPRALGHRSMLADPRPAWMKDYVNKVVKFREPFRPLAPSVLEEKYSLIFEKGGENPFMLKVARVKKKWRNRIPAVVHEDGTARVQTVGHNENPIYHQLIQEFYKKTQIPLVLNTSFNLRGMPIVESPQDAFQCFVFSKIDVLYLGHFQVQRPSYDLYTCRLNSHWRLVKKTSPGYEQFYFFENIDTGQVIDLVDQIYLPKLVKAMNGKKNLTTLFKLLPNLKGKRMTELTRRIQDELQDLFRKRIILAKVGQLNL